MLKIFNLEIFMISITCKLHEDKKFVWKWAIEYIQERLKENTREWVLKDKRWACLWFWKITNPEKYKNIKNIISLENAKKM